ncbi:pyridoxamine 5'-phosphate oxidase family protein [Pseudotenacibaculum haliotis]|uniref:Pyridoxamine 5'-phosphate oxidase family protein n=1 Tax=Pseudotenacibaculum haliotis TaxID=1862138 RepID=A0ABW5LUI7_9FLAO
MKEYSKSKLNRIKRGQNRGTYDVEKINGILDAGFICFAGYIYDGKAISIPMAYGRNGDKIYLHGSQANRMLNALLEAKEASLTVMHLDGLVLARSGLHHSVNYRSVTLFGSLKKVENDADKEAALVCVMDQMISNHWDSLRPMHQQELDRTLVVEMTIETASAKIRDVGVNDEPEDYELDVWAGVVPLKMVAEKPISDEQLKENIAIPDHVLEYYEQHK